MCVSCVCVMCALEGGGGGDMCVWCVCVCSSQMIAANHSPSSTPHPDSSRFIPIHPDSSRFITQVILDKQNTSREALALLRRTVAPNLISALPADRYGDARCAERMLKGGNYFGDDGEGEWPQAS